MNKVNPWISSIQTAKQLFISGRHLTKNAALVRPQIHFPPTDEALLHNIRSRTWPDIPLSASTLRQKLKQWQELQKSSSKDSESKNAMWDIEEDILPIILAIPNDLCDSTPLEKELVYSHEAQNYLKKTNEEKIAYEDKLAKLEMQIQSELTSTFVVKEGFFPILCPDFIKNPLDMELTSSNKPMKVDHFKDLSLTGGASLQSLLAFLVKNELTYTNEDKGCKKMISFGRLYDGNSLHLCQRTAASTLLLSRSEQESEQARDELVESLKDYFRLCHEGLSFDIYVKGAPSLSPYESHSLVFKAKENGSILSEISTFKDYLSKRLNIIYEDGRHCHLSGGTLCDVSSLIQCSY